MVRFGSQDLFWYVMEWSGFVWLGNAVKVRCCRYGIGAYCLGTAGNLQRCGGDGTYVECLGSRGWVCLGAMRRDTLWFGSRGLDGMGAVR
jgi:hypothetical protein